MRRVGLFLALFFCIDAAAYENPPMNQINELGAYVYDDEYLLSNLVYAVNERISALYKNYSVVTNCAGTKIVHNYWIDKIPTESWEVAWGTGTFEVEFTFTNTYQGNTITNTFTNVYLDFEYQIGSEPEGYLWSTNFSPQVIRHINNGGMVRGARYLIGKDVYTNVLLRVVSNDFSDVDGIRLTDIQGRPYVPCDTSDLYFQAVQQNNFYKQKVLEKVFELMPYYVGVDADQYINFPLWVWGEWGSYSPHVFLDDGTIIPGYTIDLGERGPVRVGLCEQEGEAYRPCWRYYSPPEWRFFSESSLSSVKKWLTTEYYINNYLQYESLAPFSVIGSNLNERQYSFFRNTHGQNVLGWEVNQLQSEFVPITITEPYTLAVDNPSTNYFIEGITPSLISSVYDANNTVEYINTENAYPLFDVSYIVTRTVPAGTPVFSDCSECWEIEDPEEFWDCFIACLEQPASINEKTYRVISPLFTEYGMKELLSQRATLYETNSITALIETKSAHTNWTGFDEYDPISITNEMGLLQVQTNRTSDNVPVKITDYTQVTLSATQKVERAETTITNVYEIPGGLVEGQIDMEWVGGWHKATTFPSGINLPAYTSYYETVTNTINGQEVVTNYWEPNYDLTLRHFAYATNVLQERLGVLASDRPTSFDYDKDVYGLLWSILQQMTRTRPASFIYNPNQVIQNTDYFGNISYVVGLGTGRRVYTYTSEETEPVGVDGGPYGVGGYPPISTNVTTETSPALYGTTIGTTITDYDEWLEHEANRFVVVGNQYQSNLEQYASALNFVYSLSSEYRQIIRVVNYLTQTLPVGSFESKKRWQKFTETSATTNHVTFDFYIAKDPELTGKIRAFSAVENAKSAGAWSVESYENCRRRAGPQNTPIYFLCNVVCDLWDSYFQVRNSKPPFVDLGEVFYADATEGDSKINFVYSAPMPITENIVGYDKTALLGEDVVYDFFNDAYKCQAEAVGSGEYRGGETMKEYLDLIWEWDFQYANGEN